jgi:hypothetical protein
METARALLRHSLATLAYRATRALGDSTPEFAAFNGAGKRPDQILAHMGDLFDWALSVAQGQERWKFSSPLAWEEEQLRFFAALRGFDDFLASSEAFAVPIEPLLQGPIADALTHVGQLAMLRRLAGNPTRGENFYVAAISVGQVSSQQPGPVQQFK